MGEKDKDYGPTAEGVRAEGASGTATGASVALVCGSRNWPAPWFVTAKIIELIPRDWTILTGGARNNLRDENGRPLSVDQHALWEAARLGYVAKVMLADWELRGKRAGFIRNVAMLDEGPSKVLAFQFERSKGTAHTIREAHRRGIELHWFTEADLRPDIAALDAGDFE